jgi:hypothetical protein
MNVENDLCLNESETFCRTLCDTYHRRQTLIRCGFVNPILFAVRPADARAA